MNLAIVLALVFGLLVSLAVLVPLPFERQADPFATLPGVGPPWYLLAIFGFLEWMPDLVPGWLAGLLLFLAFMALLAVPFLDRSRPNSLGRRLAVAVGLLVVVAWIVFTVYGGRVA